MADNINAMIGVSISACNCWHGDAPLERTVGCVIPQMLMYSNYFVLSKLDFLF